MTIQNMKLARACTRLMIKHPFFGSLVYQHELELTDAVPTAAATKDRMMFNPEFLERVTPEELVFLVAHEVMHIVFAHAIRRGNRDPEIYNIACDAVINEILIEEGVGDFIDGGVRMPGAQGKTSENIYNELMKHAKKSKKGGSSKESGNGSEGADGGMSLGRDAPVRGKLTIKDIRPEDSKGVTPSEAKKAELEGKMKIGQAAALARMQGKMGSGLSRLVDQLLQSKVPWYDVLERYMVSKAEQAYNWNRPHKRMLNIAYMPSRQRFPSMGEVVIGIDVSGSISDKEVAQYLGHCQAIFEQCHPAKVYVVYCTTEVEAVDEFEHGEDIVPRRNVWCGGTDMRRIMHWIDDHDVEPDVCITFTDGYTDYPNDSEVPCDLLWVLSTEYRPRDPKGEVIYAVED